MCPLPVINIMDMQTRPRSRGGGGTLADKYEDEDKYDDPTSSIIFSNSDIFRVIEVVS